MSGNTPRIDTMKNLIAAFATVLLFTSGVKADTETVDGIPWTYIISNGVASVGGGSWNSPAVPTSTSGAIAIPSTLGGYPVTRIRDYAFRSCRGLASVTMPDSVTGIGESAFEGCSALTSIAIPASITHIGSWAFYGCSGLLSATIPASVKRIEEGVFADCAGLAALSVDLGNPVYDSRNQCNAIIRTSDNSLVAGCKTTVIPDGVTSIGVVAFADCTELTSIAIPVSVTSIGEEAFAGCSGLTSITLSPRVTSVGDWAFEACDNLTSITIPETLSGETSGWGLPSGCEIAFTAPPPDGEYTETVDGIEWGFIVSDGNVFVGRGQVTTGAITIPLMLGGWPVTAIDYQAFKDCHDLTSVTIPDGVTYIDDEAFRGCSGLTSMTIPGSVEEIGNYAFSGCTGLTSVAISPGVKSIGAYAFQNCSGLTSVTLSPSVKSIGAYAFQNCFGLTSLLIPASVTSVATTAFQGCTGLTTITVPTRFSWQVEYWNLPSGCEVVYENILHTRYVDAAAGDDGNDGLSWATAKASIHAAIDDAEEYDVILVNDGRYEPIAASDITIRSVNGAGNTVIDASLLWPRGITNRCASLYGAGLVGFCLTNGIAGDGGGAYGGWLDHCVLSGNTATNCGGGAYNSSLNHCVLNGNTAARYGGGSYDGWLNNCVLSRNSADSGGGAFYGTLNNCTLYGNRITRGVGSGGCFTSGMINCIIWGNTGTAVYSGRCQYSCLDEECNGVGNIVAYPRFVDPANGDFRLRVGSPCINAGTNKWNRGSFYDLDSYSKQFQPGTSTDDLAGNPRILGGRMDMGAYEFDPDSPFPGGDQTEAVDGVEWVFSIADGEATVFYPVVSGGNPSGDFTIPSTLGGCPVTGIGDNAFFDCPGLASITIPDGVTSIGRLAFYRCSGLVSVSIPDGVTHIGEGAFFGCAGLVSVTVPASATNVDTRAFSGCGNIREVVWPGTPSLTNAFTGAAAAITNVVVAEGTQLITASAFAGCTGLVSVAIPASVANVEANSFADCTRLTSVVMSALIGTEADWGLPQRCRLVLRSGEVPSLHDNGGYVETFEMDFGAALADVEWYFTVSNGEATITGVSGLGHNNYMYTLRDLAIPSMLGGRPVTFIGDWALHDHDELYSVTIPDGVTSIGDHAFRYCMRLLSVEIPNSVTNVGNGVFDGCGRLQRIARPDALLGQESNWGLSTVGCLLVLASGHEVRYSGQSWYEEVADNIPFCFTIHSTLTYAFVNGEWGEVEEEVATISGVNDRYYEWGSVDASMSGGIIPSTLGGRPVTEIDWFDTSWLSSVTIPDSVTSIGNNAFRDSSVLRILIPDALLNQSSNWNLPSGCKVVLRSELAGRNTADGVPYEWLYQHAAPILDAMETDDCEAAAKLPAANGRPVWECYVAGLDPTDATDDFIATIEMVNGVPKISVGGRGERSGRVYTVEGKENLGDSWGPTNAMSRFFHIKVEVGE